MTETRETETREEKSTELTRYVSPLGVWAFSFGCAVGWGALVLPGTTFLPVAGPVGAALGLGIGAGIMLIIGVNYCAYTVETDVKDTLVLGDKNRLNRVLLNLLSNAYKFTPEGGAVAVTLRQTGAAAGAGSYELRVKDSGIGMSPEFAAKVFQAYEREKKVDGIQGTGLGMTITKSIVDLMGGTISVSTEPGKGSEFVVRVDFALSGGTAWEEAAEEAVEPPNVDFSTKKLLLVEDNEVNREIAAMILEELGFSLDTAENGQIAVDMVKASRPGDYDAIVMDIQMPVMNGYEAARAIRALDDPALSSIPITAMTANAFAEDIRAAKEAGMNAHIAKPLDVAKMIETLTELLR